VKLLIGMVADQIKHEVHHWDAGEYHTMVLCRRFIIHVHSPIST